MIANQIDGVILAMIVVLEFPPKESWNHMFSISHQESFGKFKYSIQFLRRHT